MNLRKALLVASTAMVALSFVGCGTVRRMGKDLGVVIISPLLIPYAAGTDAVSTGQEVRTGLGSGAAAEVLTFIPAAFFHVIKHTFYVAVHAVDFVLFPIYGLADLHPNGPEIEPLDYYTNTWFDRKRDDDRPMSTDLQSGENTNTNTDTNTESTSTTETGMGTSAGNGTTTSR